MERVLTKKEVTEALGIGPDKFYDLVRNDPDFVTFKTGHKGRRMRQSALERWIEIQEKKAA